MLPETADPLRLLAARHAQVERRLSQDQRKEQDDEDDRETIMNGSKNEKP
jgi:hypothetical protein